MPFLSQTIHFASCALLCLLTSQHGWTDLQKSNPNVSTVIRVEGFKCPTGIYQRCRKIVDIGGAKHLTSIWHARQIFENPICIMFSWGSRCGPQKLQQDFYTLSTRMAGFGILKALAALVSEGSGTSRTPVRHKRPRNWLTLTLTQADKEWCTHSYWNKTVTTHTLGHDKQSVTNQHCRRYPRRTSLIAG